MLRLPVLPTRHATGGSNAVSLSYCGTLFQEYADATTSPEWESNRLIEGTENHAAL